MMIDENSPEVQAAYAKARQSKQMVKEWSERFQAAKLDPATTHEELRELARMGVDLVDSGLEIAIPFMEDEEFPENVKEMVLKMMAQIPIFREVNSIK